MEFKDFPKMARFSRDFIITEKIDGTNASINITNTNADTNPTDENIICRVNEFNIRAGSRTRWITPSNDNHGFANWVKNNCLDLVKLGEGNHFGEWWGSGIQRGYGLTKGEKRFSLFNAIRWNTEIRPSCCSVVPILASGNFDNINVTVENAIYNLKTNGSAAVPRFMNPEGIVIFHIAANIGFKKTLEKDETPKSLYYKNKN